MSPEAPPGKSALLVIGLHIQAFVDKWHRSGWPIFYSKFERPPDDPQFTRSGDRYRVRDTPGSAGRLSSLSARILEEDFAAGFGVVPSFDEDPDSALEEIREDARSPDPFVVPKEVSSARPAAGMKVIAREDNQVQLGFAILTADRRPVGARVVRGVTTARAPR
jgi:hypothetical protein